jgi:hypothetical protein
MTDRDTTPTVAKPPKHCISCGAPTGAHLSWCPTLVVSSGMSLRDYFAAKAMQVFLTSENGTMESDAEAAYRMADAMLKAREKK